MTELEIKEQMCEVGRRVYNKGMVAANDGNFSVKLNDHEFLCTPTGVSKGFMTPEFICKVDENANVLEANEGFRPSSEIKMHMRVYKEIIYVFLTIFLYLLKCPQSLILSALRAFCLCGKPHISRLIFLYFPCQSWLKSW